MKDWKDIQDQIREAEEPLSPAAWEGMQAKLGRSRQGKRGWLLSLLALAGFLAGWAILSNTEQAKEYYHPRILSGVETQQEKDRAGQDRLPSESKPTNESTETGSPVEGEPSHKQNDSGAEFTADANLSYPENDKQEVSKDFRKVTNPVAVKTTEDKIREEQEPLLMPWKGAGTISGMESLLLMDTVFSEAENFSSLGRFKPEDQSRLALRFFMASTYNIPSLRYHTNEAQTHKDFEAATDDAVKPGWGIDAGFEVRYRLFRNFRISTGFSYREIVTQNNYDFEVSEIPVIDSASGNILAYIPTGQTYRRQESSSNMYSFLNVPVSLYYEQPLKGRWTLTGEAINNISFLINQSGYGIDPTSLELEKSSDDIFNSVINSYQLRLGLRYRVQDNFYLALEPSYRSYYQDFFKDESITWKPRDFSLSLSAIIKFRDPNNTF